MTSVTGQGSSPVDPRWPPPGPQRLRRVSAWWFAVPGLLVVVAGALLVLAMFPVLSDMLRVDARVPVDGEWHTVTVPADERLGIYVRAGSYTRCEVRDVATFEAIPVMPSNTEASRNLGDGDYSLSYEFDSGHGQLGVLCSGEAERAEIGAGSPSAQEITTFVLSLVVAVVLGSIAVPGFVLVLVLVIISRR